MYRRAIVKFLALSLLMSCTLALKAQDTTVYDKPEKRADYKGGLEHFYVYLGNNIKHRDIDFEPGQSRILVSFVVEIDGSITNIHTGQNGIDSVKQEAVRVISTMPKWDPASNSGKPVRSQVNVVVKFGKGELHDSYSDEIYTTVWADPHFFGRRNALDKFISDNLQYPQADREKKISGTVTVGFIVEKDGSLTDIKALDGPTEAMKSEAVRVMKLSPKWFPGIWEGNKFVRVQTTAQVPFTLAEK